MSKCCTVCTRDAEEIFQSHFRVISESHTYYLCLCPTFPMKNAECPRNGSPEKDKNQIQQRMTRGQNEIILEGALLLCRWQQTRREEGWGGPPPKPGGEGRGSVGIFWQNNDNFRLLLLRHSELRNTERGEREREKGSTEVRAEVASLSLHQTRTDFVPSTATCQFAVF